jgi:predicted CoA-binding protein
MSMRDARTILAESRALAVVGLSTSPRKMAHAIPADLQQAGYRVIPVHPSAEQILGEKAYRRLGDVPEPIDLVVVFRPAREAPQVAREAVEVGARALWLQLGIVSDEARSIAEAGGLDYVENRCTGVDVRRWGITPHPETIVDVSQEPRRRGAK